MLFSCARFWFLWSVWFLLMTLWNVSFPFTESGKGKCNRRKWNRKRRNLSKPFCGLRRNQVYFLLEGCKYFFCQSFECCSVSCYATTLPRSVFATIRHSYDRLMFSSSSKTNAISGQVEEGTFWSQLRLIK